LPIHGERLYGKACSPEVWQRSRKRFCGCFFSLLFSIIVEWVGMVLWWPEQGIDHSRTMLANEIRYLDTDFRRSVVTSDPARFAKEVADGTYHYLFEVTRVVAFIHWVSPPLRQEEQGMRPTLHKIYRPLAEFVIAAMQVT